MIQSLKHHRSTAVTLALGALGGVLFYALNLPLPWMLGAIVVTLIGTLAGGNLTGPEKARPYVVAVIGVMLGSGFKPDTFDHLDKLAVSLLGLSSALPLRPFLFRNTCTGSAANRV